MRLAGYDELLEAVVASPFRWPSIEELRNIGVAFDDPIYLDKFAVKIVEQYDGSESCYSVCMTALNTLHFAFNETFTPINGATGPRSIWFKILHRLWRKNSPILVMPTIFYDVFSAFEMGEANNEPLGATVNPAVAELLSNIQKISP